MKKLTCIIVDDEPLALDILEDYIRRTDSLKLVGRFTSGADALNLLRTQRGDGGRGIDLAFLDIQMPGIDGLGLAKLAVEAGDTRVIFTTAFPQYALEGFKAWALDYLLKPINFDEFSRAVGRAVEWFRIKWAGTPQAPCTLIVKSDYKQFVIRTDTIIYIEGIRDYIRIHTTGENGSVQTLMNLKTVEEMLPAGRFARVHRSYIVALDHVARIERSRIILDGEGAAGGDSAGSGVGSGTVSIPVSGTYKDSFTRALAARSL